MSLAVNLHGRGPQSHRAIDVLSPATLMGYRSAETGHDGPEWQDDEHDVDRWVRLLAHHGIEARRDDLHLDPPAVGSPRLRAAVVDPGGPQGSRRWPEDRFARTAATLARAGLDVVVTGVPSERALAERVARRAALPPTSVLAGRLDVGSTAALVATARLVVCGDTGVAHLATAFATPSVVLFASTSPEVAGPLTDGPHTVLRATPDEHRGAGSLQSISVDDVTGAALDLLDRTA